MAEDVLWIKLQSWHVFDEWVYDGDNRAPKTLCGKTDSDSSYQFADDRPKKEKSCESCLRLIAPK